MKMRIQGNAIRFRLNRREVSDFESTGSVNAEIVFPGGGRLRYTVEQGGASTDAEFADGAIRIRIPEPVLREWASSDQVGIHEQRVLEDGQQLEIIIEKDFQCMHKGEEAKDPEAYPNPMAEPLTVG